MAVIIFHLDRSWLKGGFLGVDVFLVISGFLITSIIYSQMQQGVFSLFGFWKRRVERLLPALLLVVGCVLVAGAVFATGPERVKLRWHALGAVFSCENILLWRTTGDYWASSSDNLALLHTWSLSLEEQFYIGFPILLLVVNRYARKRALLVVVAASLVSLWLCVQVTEHSRSAAFYLLPTRMWEMLAGSILAMHAKAPAGQRGHKFASMLQVVGLGLIVGSFLLIDNGRNFPGYLPVFPCAGTFLLLLYGAHEGLVNRALSLKPVAYVGRISYSLYLWHWPVVVFVGYVTPSSSPAPALFLAFALAALSYHFVECPFRTRTRRSRRYRVSASAAIASCVAFGLWLPPSPLSPGVASINDPASLSGGEPFEATEAIRQGRPGVSIGRQGDALDICVIGSSHARVLCSPIADYALANGFSLVSMATSGIDITATAPTPGRPDAGEINRSRLEHVRGLRPRVVILAGMWSIEINADNFKERLTATLLDLSESSEHVLVVGQVPTVRLPEAYGTAMRKYLTAQTLRGGPVALKASFRVPAANDRIEEVVNQLGRKNVVFLDPHDLFCNATGAVEVVADGRLLYIDYHHVNDAGASVIFERLLREPLEAIFVGHRT